jgi:predicted dehydrogenase
MLANPEIEVVDSGTHPAQRVALIHRALDAGKHVLAQKPLALTVAEAHVKLLRLCVISSYSGICSFECQCIGRKPN